MLTIAQAISRFEPLGPDDQAKALGGVSYYLTITGRDVASQGSCQEQRDKLVAINELQHKLTSHAMAIRQGAPRYPDQAFIEVLHSMSERAGLLGALLGAFTRVL